MRCYIFQQSSCSRLRAYFSKPQPFQGTQDSHCACHGVLEGILGQPPRSIPFYHLLYTFLGLHLIHLNINSLLSKIDELREIAKKTRATVIGITESKLDGEINIDGYELVRSDRNRHGGGVACYIRNDISFSVRGNFSSEIENIFLDILLPKTKPILIGILYRPPDQSKFFDNLSTSISQTCSFNEQEVYILGDLNINLINSQKHTPNGIK